MKIAIGSDHRGYELKSRLIGFLKKEGHEVRDFGTGSTESCDYPLIGYNAARSVSSGESEKGILICMTGFGMVMVANKVPGIRAARCDTSEEAKLSREHNNSNVLSLSAEYAKDKPEDIIKAWLSASFAGGRHQKRVDQIKDIENKIKNDLKRT